MPHLDRFLRAQEAPSAGFQAALAQLRARRKTGHWIWYIFPQLSGLGMSEMSRVYGLADAAEAAEYLRDATLRGRLLAAATAVVDAHFAGVPLRRLMGSSIDVQKLVSSMTLFEAVAQRATEAGTADECRRLAEAARVILNAAAAEGYAACAFTTAALVPSR